MPARISASRITRVTSKPKKAGRNSQLVISHGINPATTPGATTKNRAEPRMLIAFDIAAPPLAPLKHLARGHHHLGGVSFKATQLVFVSHVRAEEESTLPKSYRICSSSSMGRSPLELERARIWHGFCSLSPHAGRGRGDLSTGSSQGRGPLE